MNRFQNRALIVTIVFAQLFILGNAYYSGSDWQLIDGGLSHVDVGRAGVWGVNAANNIFYRVGTYEKAGAGTRWQLVDGSLKNIAVGHDIVWGIHPSGGIYYRHGISETTPTGESGWIQVAGGLALITVNSIDNGVYGINAGGQIFQRAGISCADNVGTGWTVIAGGLSYISYGYSGVWGVNSVNTYFYLDKSFRSNNILEPTPFWSAKLELKLRTISSGANGVLWATGVDDKIYEADNISCDNQNPVWKQVAGGLRQISVSNYNGEVWGVNANNNIFRRDL